LRGWRFRSNFKTVIFAPESSYAFVYDEFRRRI
jgi:hypothetical protein